MRKWLAVGCGVMLALAAALTALTLLIDGAGRCAPLMASVMEKYAPAEATGLPGEQYPAMAEMITGYLSGQVDTFQFEFKEDGIRWQCFLDKEQRHMADVRGLFDLCRKVMLLSAGALVALGLVACCLRAHKRRVARGFAGGCLLVLAALTGLAVWAVVDFDGLFVLFHRLSFTNDLWLLDPRTDMLIRLMPTAFFIHYAALLGGGWLGLLLLMAAVARHLSARWKS